ncbi:MAG: deoxyribonuclease IV [Nitrospirae bacterium]|nr:deoxyribonuclease IV [Nitrospirota bacterium]
MLLGAHMSIAGGVDKAIERGTSLSCTAIQVFTKNANQWQGRPLRPEEIGTFLALRAKSKISKVIAHDSYLINLATSHRDLKEKSINALIREMERCKALEIPCIVIHPGAHLEAGEETGIRNISNSLNTVLHRTEGWGVAIALETTAGQGTSIGYRFEHLRQIKDGVREKDRIKTCLDTCHLFAAGYDIRTPEGYHKVISDFDRTVGLDSVACFHVNDSKKGLGSRVDRHEQIGKGHIGIRAFRLLMNDKRFKDIPRIIETPKGKEMEEDRVNLALLRSLVK